MVTTAKRAMFVTFCLGGVASSIVYLVKTYVNVFYQDVLHLDNKTALIYLAYTAFVMMIAQPISGGIADRIGRFRMITLSSIAILILILPTLLFMATDIMWQQLMALTVLGIVAGGVSGTAYVFIISLFKPEQRFSGVGFSYNLGIAMFGGTSPIISRWLVEVTGLFYAPAFYIMTTSGIFLIIIYYMRHTIRSLINNNYKDSGA